MEELEDANSESSPVWAIFGDLMSGLVGVFVLILVWVLGFQLELAKTLEEEVKKREAEEQRRLALEQALADPLSSGRVTLRDGRIGIRGSFLFASNSDQLQPEGEALLQTLVEPLHVYLTDRDQLLMISGFTDNRPIQSGNLHYKDNWELSAQRALTVTRALIDSGMPQDRVFAAAFGAQQPVVENSDDESRAKNRRVEMAPVPRNKSQTGASQANAMAIDNPGSRS
ncbi:OmpA family protein [uncultured Pseudoteredinibacter sp.]|uniref:OmpA family protein n=1 Tax=uncultured Pseudoteredinibacter sp. TaxID=1641701 RepID=UPI00261AAD04|nr:OmpA family protein [uncultured Pseudoteredinibacter sp.]